MASRSSLPLALLGALLLAVPARSGELLRKLWAREEPLEAVPSLKVSTEWLSHHRADEDLVVLHVARYADGYEKGHVPGARFVPFDRVVDTRGDLPNELPHLQDLTALARELGLRADDRVIVYDEERGLQAARLFFTLEYLGFFGRVALLDGGWVRWEKEGRARQRLAPEVRPSRYVPAIRPEVLADLRLTQDLVWQARAGARTPIRIVDARPKEDYSGELGHPALVRRGHIPGARSAPWTTAQRASGDPRLLPDAELRALHAPGLEAGATVVTYCNTGVQAAYSYYVLRYLGFEPRLYDGSMAEWSRQADTAVLASPWPSGM